MPQGSAKDVLISLGLYRPARFIQDHWLRPVRLKEMEETRKAFSRFVKPGDLCFDIGANIGQKSEALLQLEARVVSVEPQPRCARELKARCKRYPNFVAIQKAVGRQPGRETIHISRTDIFSSMNREWTVQQGAEQIEQVEVEVTTLDQLIEAHGVPDFCKIDVEGFELEVFGGLTQPMKTLSFEFHNVDQPGFRHIAFECMEHLTRLGDIRLNVSLIEDMRLLLEDFLPYDAFLPYYKDLLQKPETIYGDIYVRFEPSA